MSWKIYDKTEKQISYKKIRYPGDPLYERVVTIPVALVEYIQSKEHKEDAKH